MPDGRGRGGSSTVRRPGGPGLIVSRAEAGGPVGGRLGGGAAFAAGFFAGGLEELTP